MIDLTGKRLLVLGGGSAALSVVQTAKEAGVYTIATDYLDDGEAKRLADETALVSTADIPALAELMKQKHLDGVFCGPSEFNLQNAIKLCEYMGIPFYATSAQWDQCADKANFKAMCRKHGVPCVPEYHVTEEFLDEDLASVRYPVMVKPVDASSSRGIAVCYDRNELIQAYRIALTFSVKKKVIVEKYISNENLFAVRYVVYHGQPHMLLANDRYVVDPVGRRALISGVAIYPSKHTARYLKTIDKNVQNMLRDLGVQNGAMFMQALIDPEDGNIYFHEMGLRLSGGLTYSITGPTTGINDMLMMIRLAVGAEFSTPEEIAKVDPYLNGKTAIALCIPLRAGVIASIEGVEEALAPLALLNYTQYYQVGAEITDANIGTLDQHFCRIKFLVDRSEDIAPTIHYIQDHLKICDAQGQSMIFMPFDTNRLSL